MTGAKRIVVTIAAALFVAAFLLYLPSLRYGFVEYDDVRILLNHPTLYDEHSLVHSLHQIFVGYFPREEPLLIRDVSWAIDSRLFGFQSAFGHHLGNVLVNALNAPLLFLFLVAATRRVRFAAIVAAAWTVLPVHVEPVCWVMGRKDLLCAFFALATLVVEARALDAARPARLRVAGVVLYALAVLSKTSAVTFVGVIAAYRLFGPSLRTPSERPRRLASTLAGVTPHLCISAAVYVWYNRVLHQWGVLHAASSTTPTQRLAELAQLGPLSLGCYLRSIFAFPDFSLIYLWPDSAIPLGAGERAAAVAIVVALVAFVVWTALRRRDLAFYVLSFFALMLPYLHIVDVIRWRADRYVYLSSFCVLAVAVQLALELVARARPALARVIAGGAVAWALVAALVTLTSSPRFADDRALWTWEVSLRHPSPAAYVSLASSLVAQARTTGDAAERARVASEAERVASAGEDYYRSIPWRGDREPRRDLANLEVQLGQVSALRGEPVAAQLAHYEASYRIAPTDANILFLAQAMLRTAAAAHDVELARKSLQLYATLLATRSSDAPRRAVNARVLAVYRQSFPELGPELDALERAYVR